MASVWKLIESGDFEGACVEADLQATRSPSLLPLRNKVRALLHLCRFEEAERLERQIIGRDGGEAQSDFLFLGISLWCQGRFKDSVAAWESGLLAKYTDAAGGVQLPMLLLYGSVNQGDPRLRANSLSRLDRHAPSKNWPAPLADYVSGDITEDALRSNISTQPSLRIRQTCQTEFYVGVMRRTQGDENGALVAMRNACNQGPISFLEAEYYLARWETMRK